MNLTIIGTGYVGLTTGTCFAEVGHHVTCVDNNPEKIETLLAGRIPIYEPGLEDLVKKNVAAGRLKFTTSTEEGVRNSEVVFIAVPTPPQADGSVDLSFIEKVAREIAECVTPEHGYRVIVDKSTVPVKTGEKVQQTVRRYAPKGVEPCFDISARKFGTEKQRAKHGRYGLEARLTRHPIPSPKTTEGGWSNLVKGALPHFCAGRTVYWASSLSTTGP